MRRSSELTSALEGDERRRTGSTVYVRGRHVPKQELLLYGVILILVLICMSLIIAVAVLDNRESAGTSGGSDVTPACTSQACLQAASVMLQNMNASAEPCEDFFQYACANFPGLHPILPELSSSGTLQDLYTMVEDDLHVLLEEPIQRYGQDAWERKVKDYYSSCVQESWAGTMEGLPLLQLIRDLGWTLLEDHSDYNVTDWRDIPAALRTVHTNYWAHALYQIMVVPSPIDATDRIIAIRHSGLGMPLSLYFGEENALIKTSYTQFIAAVGSLLLRDAGLDARSPDMAEKYVNFVKDAYTFESDLAQVSMATLSSDTLSMSTIGAVATAMPQLQMDGILTELFEANKVSNTTAVWLDNPTYLTAVNELIADRLNSSDGPRILNNYLVWRVAQRFINDLSYDYRAAEYSFQRTMTGDTELDSRWRVCVHKAMQLLPQAVSALYVQKHDVDDDVDKVTYMTRFIQRALLDKLQNIKWMDSPTVTHALAKIESVAETIGYEDVYRDDATIDAINADLVIQVSSVFQNSLNWNYHHIAKMNTILSKQADDRIYWLEGAFQVLPYLTEFQNQFTAPAAGIRAPLFARDLPMAANFGGLGVEIARQHTHVVDQRGRKYLANGKRENWWSDLTQAQYSTEADCFNQTIGDITYGPYDIAGRMLEMTKPGAEVASWIIPEVGGIKDALHGYKMWQEINKEKKTLPGLNLTDVQTFFLAYAQTNCFNRRDRMTWNLLHTGLVPEYTRVNEALRQTADFKEAFHCSASSGMAAARLCDVF